MKRWTSKRLAVTLVAVGLAVILLLYGVMRLGGDRPTALPMRYTPGILPTTATTIAGPNTLTPCCGAVDPCVPVWPLHSG
ncbi:MAG: hypothetical protein K8T91_15515 [Planctomycetes bacterium]|nr:hypothetical protein [Planctomycetota bacterium]